MEEEILPFPDNRIEIFCEQIKKIHKTCPRLRHIKNYSQAYKLAMNIDPTDKIVGDLSDLLCCFSMIEIIKKQTEEEKIK